ncbi:MFS transporter [Clostridium sp. D2Q-11]|uniref:MFS transporter n=2 Tax=Anaeromonas frigoriresistens TaxID=2683708 RepID=A0A942Z643_9FIRM|nr:MFS transporter [Anaeromonas frigoriresistens]
MAYVIVFFHRVAAGVVRQELINSFNITDVEFGNFGAMYFYPYMLMQIPSGILADTLGARKTVSVGIILAGIGSLIFGFAPNITFAYIGRLTVGLGVSVVFISTLKILSQWFKPDEFGRMSGLTSFIGNGGALLAQYPLVVLVAAIGWRKSFSVIGGISVIIAIVTYILVRNKPEDLGLDPIVIIKEKKKSSIKDGLKIVFTNPRTWPAFFAMGGIFGSVIAFMGTWGVPYMIDVYGLTKGEASIFTMMVTLGLMIGSLIVGNISDRLGKRRLPFAAFSIVYLVVWIVFLFVNPGNMSLGFMYVLFFLMGLTSSGFVLSWACGKEVNPEKYAGVSTSIANMGGFLFAAIIQPIIGFVLEQSDGAGGVYSVEAYNKAFMVCLVVIIISLVSLFLIKETNCKNIYSE